jgi:dimethylhistidine N-methyltransferase
VTIASAEVWGSQPSGQAVHSVDAATVRAVTDAVRKGLLRPRMRLPPWLLYDAQGSALFEDITNLPEYYLTRAERGILASHAGEIVESAGAPPTVIELGAGTASKTQLLLAALLDRQTRVTYMPVDVSAAALSLAQSKLSQFRRLTVRPVVARYPEELGFLDAPSGRRLLLFLGSNLGNYDPAAARKLLRAVRRHLLPGDAFLIGTDLRKARSVLVPAYDDAQGVTARFNKNVLVRLNREVGATFDVDRFEHVVHWNRAASRIELYLASVVAQTVSLGTVGAKIHFAPGKRIHTESSYKFTRAMRDDRSPARRRRLSSGTNLVRRTTSVRPPPRLCFLTGHAALGRCGVLSSRAPAAFSLD